MDVLKYAVKIKERDYLTWTLDPRRHPEFSQRIQISHANEIFSQRGVEGKCKTFKTGSSSQMHLLILRYAIKIKACEYLT